MAEDEKDVYSAIYSALKHPIRRRILCMLSEKMRTFTEMLKVFGIESSHLTYHLESLEGLICKSEDGNYKLSSLGEIAASMMGQVEEEVSSVEEITGIIQDAYVRRKYWLPEVCDLFFTDKRVVSAVVLSRKATAGYDTFIGVFGLSGWYLARRDRERYRMVFEGKKPSEILLLEQDNFEIPYNDVLSVTLHKGFLKATIEFKMCGGERLKFSFSAEQFSDARKTVQKVLKNKLAMASK